MKGTMFTGIIRHVGRVSAVADRGGGRRLSVDLGPLADGLRVGDSVAVSGACLTAAEVSGSQVEFDVVAETLRQTTLGKLSTGSKVNLERALTAGQALDGHLVQGHVDGRATVREVRRGGQWVVTFGAPRELAAQLVSKGSIAVDGVSLTPAEVSAEGFSVALIPTTLAETTLTDLRGGDEVNIELDVIGKYVRAYLQQIATAGGDGVTLEKLKRAGFA